MKRKTRNPIKTKQEIIEKSAPVFNVHGYEGTSMKMLVEATGYQMGGIYRHFDTKTDLAKAVFQYNYETLIKSNLDLAPALNPRQKLMAIIENYAKMVLQPKIKGGCPLLNTSVEVDDTDEEFRVLAKSKVKEVLVMVAEILEEGKQQGYFRPEIEPRKEAAYLFATFEGAIFLGNLLRSAKSVFDVFGQIVVYLEKQVFLN